MRTLPFIFTALFMLCGSAMATPSSAEKSGDPAPFRQALTTEQLHELQGTYRLANGRKLQLSASDDRMYASLNGRDLIELVATAENTLSSKDGAISVNYQPQQPSEELRVSYSSALPAAAPYMPYERSFPTR